MADSVVKNANKENNDITILGPGEELSVEEELQMGDNLLDRLTESKEEQKREELRKMFEDTGSKFPKPPIVLPKFLPDETLDRILQSTQDVDLREYQYKDLAPPLYGEGVEIKDITYQAPVELPMKSEPTYDIGIAAGGNVGIETLKKTTMQTQEKPASRSALVLKRILKQAGVENVDPLTMKKVMSVLKQVEEKKIDDLQLIPKEFRKIEEDLGFGITTLRDKTDQEKYLSEFVSQVPQDDLRYKQYENLADPLFKNFNPLSSFTSFRDLKRMRTTTTDEEGNEIPFSGNVRPIIKEDGSVEMFDVGI
tara:strand:+ start:120 stop:1046 length:927 start_codon:yes stop_codon:yes gene_type:complete